MDDLARRGRKAVTWFPTAGQFVAWSPDSRAILTQYFGVTSADLAMVDPASGKVTAITLHGADDLFSRDVTVGWQPDGSGLLAVQRLNDPLEPATSEPSRLWSFDLTGAATGSRPMPRADQFQLSPDGRRMLIRVTLGAQEPVVYEFASGRSTPVPR